MVANMAEMQLDRDKEKLKEIEGRFLSWQYLSDTQELDIAWLIVTLRKNLNGS